jgi:hypothetical protein
MSRLLFHCRRRVAAFEPDLLQVHVQGNLSRSRTSSTSPPWSVGMTAVPLACGQHASGLRFTTPRPGNLVFAGTAWCAG